MELLICGCRNIHDGHVSEFNFEKLVLRVNFLKARRGEICTPKKNLKRHTLQLHVWYIQIRCLVSSILKMAIIRTSTASLDK